MRSPRPTSPDPVHQPELARHAHFDQVADAHQQHRPPPLVHPLPAQRQCRGEVPGWLESSLFFIFCFVAFAGAIWVRSTFSSHCPLSPNQRHCSAKAIIFPLKKLGKLGIKPGAAGWEASLLPLCFAAPLLYILKPGMLLSWEQVHLPLVNRWLKKSILSHTIKCRKWHRVPRAV